MNLLFEPFSFWVFEFVSSFACLRVAAPAKAGISSLGFLLHRLFSRSDIGIPILKAEGYPSIHVDRGARDHPRSLRCEEDDGIGNVLWLYKVPRGRPASYRFSHLRSRVRLHQGGQDDARADGIDIDSVGSEFKGKMPCKSQAAALEAV
jgi:hypothetical protein